MMMFTFRFEYERGIHTTEDKGFSSVWHAVSCAQTLMDNSNRERATTGSAFPPSHLLKSVYVERIVREPVALIHEDPTKTTHYQIRTFVP